MKKLVCLICCITVFYSCENNSHQEEKELSPQEKITRDSISRKKQKVKVDSLKKKNPLLIMPPDSAYTGDYVDKYSNGITKFKGYFRFGKRHGQWMSFYPSGLLWSEMHYDKGLRQGPNMTYFENGTPRYIGFYKNDKQDSIWCYYDTLGKLDQRVVFKNDIIIKKLPVK